VKRFLIISHIAAAMLLGGSIVGIYWATQDGSATTRSAQPVAELDARSSPSPAIAAAPSSATPSPASGSSLTPLVELVPARPVPPGPQLHRAGPAALPPPVHRARKNFRLEVQDGLAALQEDVARRCSASDTSFVLEVESVDGGIKILDATLDSQGNASDKAVSCAQKALRGHFIESPSAEPGRHWKLSFAIVGS
jgi:hypothetical protein